MQPVIRSSSLRSLILGPLVVLVLGFVGVLSWSLAHRTRHNVFPGDVGGRSYQNLSPDADASQYEVMLGGPGPSSQLSKRVEQELQGGVADGRWPEGAMAALRYSLQSAQSDLAFPITVDSALCAIDICQVRLSFATEDISRDLRAFQKRMSAVERTAAWTGPGMGSAVMAFMPHKESSGYRIYVVITTSHL